MGGLAAVSDACAAFVSPDSGSVKGTFSALGSNLPPCDCDIANRAEVSAADACRRFSAGGVYCAAFNGYTALGF